MKERAWLSFVLAVLAALACLFLGLEKQGINTMVIFALVFACLITAKLFIELLKAPASAAWVCALLCGIGALAFGMDCFLPLMVFIAADFLSERFDLKYALALTAVLALLFAVVLPQQEGSLLAATFVGVIAFVGARAMQVLQRARTELGEKSERIAALENQLERQRSTISTIEQQGRQAERNRLAARIHDKVGHGMTGSILLLEAARLQWKTDPQTADASIEKAAENLRETVDEIRRELREERSLDNRASLSSIAAELDEFSAEHSDITTELVTEGNLDRVPQALWYCIYESLLETLTNMLKHSGGTHFRVSISQRNRLVSVEFGDNGGKAYERDVVVAHGIGLANIEERVLMSGGRASFVATPRGFTTKLIFTLREQI